MIVKKCKVSLSKNEVLEDYTRNVNGNIEIFEKTEGNYTEIVAKILGITDEFMLTATGGTVSSNYIENENFIVYPNCTLQEYLARVNTFEATVIYTEELTQI